MKGLLLKDWYLIKSYCLSFFVIAMVMILATAFVSDVAVFESYPVLFAGMIPMTLQSYDEKEKWHVYSGTLPVSRAQFVSAKYLIGLLDVAVVIAATVLVRAVSGLALPGRGTAVSPTLFAAAGLGLFAPAVALPLVFRFGAEKARIIYLILVAVVAGASYILLDNDGAPSLVEATPAAPAVLCLAALALYAVSWAISVASYKRREL